MTGAALVTDDDFDLDEVPAGHWAKTDAAQPDSPATGQAEPQ